MKGVAFASVGADAKVVDDLDKPVPGPDQVLVKSIWAAINPVDGFMVNAGLLVVKWPVVLGVDAGGVIVEAGVEATSKYGLKVGDEVFGCTRLGTPGYSSGQEFFLMDAAVTIPKPANLSLAEAATLGVGSETACLGVFDGLQIPVPDVKSLPGPRDEWIVILGGASSVGRAAVQLARACGYKVAASCSTKSAADMQKLGATPFDYKKPLEQQVKEVLHITSGKVTRIFDAVAANDPILPKELFKASSAAPKFFSTTNDWSGIGDFEGGKTTIVELGPIGRPEATELNRQISTYVPLIAGLIEAKKLLPPEYEVIGEGGFEAAIQAYKHQLSGAGGSRKVLVKIQDK